MTAAPTTNTWQIAIADEARMRLLAEIVAVKVTAGDMITLRGGLGAGKTTFSRYLIRALLENDAAEVPSPTFTLVQTYDTPRFEVRHFDLYRVSGADELDQLEFDDADDEHLTLVEWPEVAEGLLGRCRFDVMIDDARVCDADGGSEARNVSIVATPGAAWRLGRMRALHSFCAEQFEDARLAGLRIAFLQGDASARGYARVRDGDDEALLMDMPRLPDGPVIRDGKTYSEIAHLAEDARPFVAIASALQTAGVSAPRIEAFDDSRGLALIEDLGPRTFGEAMAAGVDQDVLWHAAMEVLVHLRQHPPAEIVGEAGSVRHQMPLYDSDVMLAEVELLADWYWPHAHGVALSDPERLRFVEAWAPLIERVATGNSNPDTSAWVLRDYHSPNLIWMPERTGIAQVGVIDFQDAQIGHAAYDLASLAMDARLDVPRALCEALVDAYCAQAARQEPTFDAERFRLAFAILGAQRNTKILGIFARLSQRDGKHGYLRHIPRIQQYLSWCLEHPALAPLRAWYGDMLELGASESATDARVPGDRTMDVMEKD